MLLLLGSLQSLPPNVLFQIMLGLFLGALIGMTVHEYAHNYVGHLMGDPVPAAQGRLTLNPAVHINWGGFLMFVLIGFGILGQAPIAAYRMRNPRYGYLAAVAAGPFSNLLAAIVFGLIFRVLGGFSSPVGLVLVWIVQMNLLLFLFNLIPLAPLDGWFIVYALLPPKEAYWWESTAQYSQFIFLGVILLSFTRILPPALDPLNILLREPLSFFLRIIIG